MRSEALAIAKEETRRQIAHDTIVGTTALLTHPVVLTVGGLVAVEYFTQKGYWSGLFGNRIRSDLIEGAITTAALSPVLQPIMAGVVKGAASVAIGALTKGKA